MPSDLLRKSSLAVLFACAFFASSGARAINNAGSSDTFSSASASAYAGAVASVGTLNGASAFTGTGNFPETHEGHKGIRSYDNTNFPHDNDPNRGVKPLEHHREMKSGGHDKDDCSKCKWENDDYWERDEPEEERDGDECDDGDDGQYKPDKTYHHDGNRVHASGLHPSGVYKTGPTGVYGDNAEAGVKGGKSDGPPNFPTTNRYAGSTYEPTPKPGSSWNTPFVGTSKPGYSGVGSFATTPSYGSGWNRGTTPTSFGSMPVSNGGYSSTFAGTISNTGFGGAPARSPSSQKPGSSWSVNHDNMPAGSYGTTPKPETSSGTSIGGFPAPQKPRIPWSGGHDGTFANSYGTTPGQRWNTPTSPSSYKPSPNWNADRDNTPAGSFGTTSRPGSSWNTGTPVAESPFSQKPVAPWNTEHDSASVGSLGATTKSQLDRHTGFNSQSESGWNPNKGIASFGTSGCAQPHLSCNQGKQGPVKVGATPFDSSLAKSNEFPSGVSPGASHGESDTSGARAGTSVIPSFGSTPHGEIPDFGQKGHPSAFDKTTANIFGPTKSPHGGFSPPGTFSHGNTLSPGKTPESPTGGSIYEYSGTAKPGYGSGTTSSWSNAGHTGSGSNDWPGSHAVFPVSNTGFGTTKTPFSHVSSTPGSSGSPYGGARPKLTGFNVASSNAVAGAVAGANAFGTSFGTYNTPGVTGTPFVDSTPSARTGGYAGVKGSSGSVIPTYGTGHHGAQPGAWPDKQPGTTPGRQPNGGNSPLPNQQFESEISASGGHPGSGNWPSRQPGGGSATTPGGYFGSDSGTWPRGGITPSDHRGIGISPGRHSAGSTWPGGQVGPECTSGSCGSPNGPFSGSNSCGGNCGCGGESNAPTTHGPCSGVISGPSGVNKTYYPAGTGDGSVPNIANTYSSLPNTGSGAYPGFNTGCNSCNQGGAGVIPGDSVQWNSANPFLYGSVDGIRNDASRPWSGTTPKPIGKGNLFLDSGWGSPKPASNNANNDRNVIPLGQENKPFNEENPFLNGNKRRGDIPVTTDERVIPLGERKPDGSNPFGAPLDSRDPSYGEHPVRLPGSRIPGSSGYGGVKSGPYSGGVSPQSGNSGAPYPARDSSQDVGPLQCKLGLFGCGTPNSGSYAGGKHPGEVHAGIGGNIGAGTGSVNSSPGDLKSSGVGNYGGGFNIGAGHPGSIGSNFAGSVGGAHAGAYAGSFSSAQASSSSFANAKSFSGTGGHGDNFGQANSGSWSSSGAQNQAEPNSWASSGASAFASSSAGGWSGNHPVDVKG